MLFEDDLIPNGESVESCAVFSESLLDIAAIGPNLRPAARLLVRTRDGASCGDYDEKQCALFVMT